MSYPATPVSSEACFAALFALGCSIAGTSGKPSATPFVTTSRIFRQWSQTTSAQWPALYQFQVPETASGYDRGVGRLSLRAWWFIYLAPSSGPQDVVSTRMNAYQDALLAALKPTPQMGPRQTLGIKGVVNVYPEGQILIDEGLLDPPALIRIPITILIGQ
jgi:hypothetical protein